MSSHKYTKLKEWGRPFSNLRKTGLGRACLLRVVVVVVAVLLLLLARDKWSKCSNVVH